MVDPKELEWDIRSSKVIDSYAKASNWFLAALVSAALVSNHVDPKSTFTKLFGFEIPTELIGTITYFLLFAFSFRHIRLLTLLSQCFENLNEIKEKVRLDICTYPWALNPFSERDKWTTYILDIWGFGILPVLLFLGMLTGIQLLWGQEGELSLIWGQIFFFGYVFLYLWIIAQTTIYLFKFNKHKKLIYLKIILTIVLGAVSGPIVNMLFK